jgi:hypothetical protein
MTTERWVEQDIAQPIVVQHCEGVVFTADNNGNIIGVKLYKDGTAFNPSGTATCNVIRPDGVTVSFNGTVSGNAISATLPVTALAVPGVIGVVLQSISGSVVTTVFKGMFTCEMTTTETVVAPSVHTSSLAQLTQDVINLQNSKVNKSGDTMTGALNVPGLNTLGNYPGMTFRQSAGSTPTGYITENNATRRMYFTVVPTDAGGNEVFNLPAPSTGNTSQRNFDILTTKDWLTPVSVTTGVARVTVQYNNSFKLLNKLVVVNARLSIATGTAIAVNSGVCNVQQAAYVPSSPGDTGTFATISAAPYGPFKISPNGTVTATVQIPADYSGTITISGVYIAA